MTDLIHSLQQLWAPGARLVVAVSGGPDSLCLLHLLHRLALKDHLTLHVAHVDHQLRAESAGDAAFVQETAAAWGVGTTVLAQDVQVLRHTAGGVEAAARLVRYQFFAEVVAATGATGVVLGHTADDQAETVLLRLLRGTGTAGLAAMRPRVVRDDGLVLFRPLLAVRRTETLAYCAAHGLAPRHDASNADLRFVRNRVRAALLPMLHPYNLRIVAALNRTARLCAEDNDFLEAELDQRWAALGMVATAQRVVLRRSALLALPPALQRRAVRRAVALLGPLTDLGGEHVDRMLLLVGRGGRLQLPAGCWLVVRGDDVIVEKG